jgi:hypothetical protein
MDREIHPEPVRVAVRLPEQRFVFVVVGLYGCRRLL